MNIFVGSLPFGLEEAELKEIFEEYGEVASAKIISDKFSGRSKGFGFIEMPDEDNAKRAIDELNGAELDGRTIVVNKAEEKKQEPRRSGGGGGFNRGGGGGYDRGGSRGGYNRDSSGGNRFNGGNRRSSY
jgi:RNA recognition motif-containing protein